MLYCYKFTRVKQKTNPLIVKQTTSIPKLILKQYSTIKLFAIIFHTPEITDKKALILKINVKTITVISIAPLKPSRNNFFNKII